MTKEYFGSKTLGVASAYYNMYNKAAKLYDKHKGDPFWQQSETKRRATQKVKTKLAMLDAEKNPFGRKPSMKKQAGRRRKQKTFGGTRAKTVVTNKYNPTTSLGSGGNKKRGVSKKFYGKVMKAIHGDNKQVLRFTYPPSLSDTTWLAYDEILCTGGQATNIMPIATGFANLADVIPCSATRQYTAQLYQIFRSMAQEVVAPGATRSATANTSNQVYGEPNIYLKSINVDVTVINNQTLAGQTIDLDVYEVHCKRDVPITQTFTSPSATDGVQTAVAVAHDNVVSCYNQFMTRTVPSRSDSITTNRITGPLVPTANDQLQSGFNPRMVNFDGNTLGTTPYHNPGFSNHFKIGRKTKIFLAPGENARMQFNYKVNKKIYAKNVTGNIALKGVSKSLIFIPNNIDRSAGASSSAFAFKATIQYNYIDVKSTVDSKQIYKPVAFV